MLDKMRECKKCKEILVKVKRVKKNFKIFKSYYVVCMFWGFSLMCVLFVKLVEDGGLKTLNCMYLYIRS